MWESFPTLNFPLELFFSLFFKQLFVTFVCELLSEHHEWFKGKAGDVIPICAVHYFKTTKKGNGVFLGVLCF